MTDIEQQIASAPVSPGEFTVREITEADRPFVQSVLRRYWASLVQVSKGRRHQADELPGFLAMRDDEIVGMLTYDIQGDECEVVTHNSLAGHGGIGSCLMAAVRAKARESGCKRLWLVTTNDNTSAIRFYQRRDFNMVAVHRDAVKLARTLKPEIPDIGMDGIPIRHEVELEYVL